MKILKDNEYIREGSIAWYVKKYWKPALAVGLSVAVLGSAIAFAGTKGEAEAKVQEPIESLPISEFQAFTPIDEVPLDADLQEFIFGVAEDYGLEGELVMAVIGQESNYNHCVLGDDGESYGLMQVQKSQHEDRMERLKVTDLYDPYENVLVGIDYLAECMSKYPKVASALTVYNAGERGANELYFSRGIDGNGYANKVMERWETLIENQ